MVEYIHHRDGNPHNNNPDNLVRVAMKRDTDMLVSAAPGQHLEYILINTDGDVIDRAHVFTDAYPQPAAHVINMWQNELENGAVIFTRVHPKL